MTRVPVALFNDRVPAEPIRDRLAQAGIAAEIHDEAGLEKLWFVPKTEALVRLEVPANQFEKGEQLLVEWDSQDGALHEAIHCPECKSLLVQYPQMTQKSVMTNVAMGLAAQFHLIEREYYCQECHFTWPREGKKARPSRPNCAPYYFIRGIEQTRLAPDATNKDFPSTRSSKEPDPSA